MENLKLLPTTAYNVEMVLCLGVISVMGTLLSFSSLRHMSVFNKTTSLSTSPQRLTFCSSFNNEFRSLVTTVFLRWWYITWPLLAFNLYKFPVIWQHVEYYSWRTVPCIFFLTLCIWYGILTSYFEKQFIDNPLTYINYIKVIGIFSLLYNVGGSWYGPFKLLVGVVIVTIVTHSSIWLSRFFYYSGSKMTLVEVVKQMSQGKMLAMSFLYTSLCVFAICFLYLLIWKSVMIDVKYIFIASKMYTQALQWFYLIPEIVCLIGLLSFPLLDSIMGLFNIKNLAGPELTRLKATTLYWILLIGFMVGFLWLCFYWYWSSDLSIFMLDKANLSNLSDYKWGLYFPGSEGDMSKPSLQVPLHLFNYSLLYDMFAVVIKDLMFFLFMLMVLFTKDKFIDLYCTSGISFYMAFLFLMLGTFTLVSSFDFMVLFLAFEVVNFSSYILIVGRFSMAPFIYGAAHNMEASTKYYLISGMGSIFMGMGTVLLFLAFGSTNFVTVVATSFNITSISTMFGLPFKPVTTGMFFILLTGIFLKLGIFPGHTWLADMYGGLSWFIILIISAPVKLAVATMLLRIIEIFSMEGWIYMDHLRNFLLLSALGSLIVGSLYAAHQKQLKPFFAYASMSQMGVFTLGLSTVAFWGYFSSLFFLIGYILTAFNFLLIIMLIENQLSFFQSSVIYLTDLFSFSDKIRFSNFYLVSVAICLLSFSGMPPLYGFFAKFNMLMNTLQSEYYLTAVIFILTSILSIYYYLSLFIISSIETNEMQTAKGPMTGEPLPDYTLLLAVSLTSWVWMWLPYFDSYFNNIVYRFTYLSICMFHNMYFAT